MENEDRRVVDLKIYWCQCYDVNRKIAEKNIGRANTRDTGMVCGECGRKIFEETKK